MGNEIGTGLPPTRATNAPAAPHRTWKDYSATELTALASSRNTAKPGQPPSFDFRDLGLGPGMGTIKDGQIYFPAGAITANGNHAIYIGAGKNGESSVSAVPNHTGNFISNTLKFKASEGKGFLKDLIHDPSRLLTGIDPFSTSMWNKVLGTHKAPLVDYLGGATQQRYKDAEAQGIDTSAGRTTEKIAHVIASYYGGAALGNLAGGGAAGASGGATPSVTAATPAGLGVGSATTLTPAEIAAAGGGSSFLGGAASGAGGAGGMQSVVVNGLAGAAGAAGGGLGTAAGVAGGLAAGAVGDPATPNTGSDSDTQTVEVHGQRPVEHAPNVPQVGIDPYLPAPTVPGAEPVDMQNPDVEKPPKDVDKSTWEKLTPAMKKLLPKLLSLGIPAAAAIGMVNHGSGGSGGSGDANSLIGKQTAVGDDLGKKMEDLYPQLKNSLANANTSATDSAARLNGYANDANAQSDSLKKRFDETIDPQLQQSLKDNATFTRDATKRAMGNAGRMEDLAGEQSGLWNNFTKVAAQNTLDKAGKEADYVSSQAHDQAGKLGAQAEDLQSQWKSYMYPMLQQQVADGKITADAATAKFNQMSLDTGREMDGLRGSMANSRLLTDRMTQQAMDYNTDGNYERQAGLALGDIHTQFGAQRQAELQKMQSYGIDPTSGRYVGQSNISSNNEAAAGAAAASRARDAAVQLGWQKSLDANQAIVAANSGYNTYANLSSTQGNNVRGGLDAQNQHYNNILNLNNAANSHSNAYQQLVSAQGVSGQRGMDAQSMQMGNVDRFAGMSDRYSSGQVSIAGALNNSLAAGAGIQRDGFGNISTANSIYDNNNAAILAGKTVAGGLTKDANGILANNVDTNGNAIKTVAGAAGTQANIYGNAGSQANDIYRTDKASKAAELGGLGTFAGSVAGSKLGQEAIKGGLDWLTSGGKIDSGWGDEPGM